MAPSYEISLIVRSLEKPALLGLLRKSASFITGQGGVIRDVNNAGNKVLPYRMKSHMQYAEVGQFAFLTADMAPGVVKELSTRLRNDSSVIRHSIVKLPHATVATREKAKIKGASSASA